MAAYRLDLMTQDHPRIRGEHVHIEAPRCPQMGSSPHTRGALEAEPGVTEAVRIIPAYAGSTLRPEPHRVREQDHPRIRGEHFREVGTLIFDEGSSPHTRGAPNGGESIAEKVGIIPAYAGSTPTTSSRCPPSPDHPRIRGEHESLGQWSRREMGSSPHTRGAR